MQDVKLSSNGGLNEALDTLFNLVKDACGVPLYQSHKMSLRDKGAFAVFAIETVNLNGQQEYRQVRDGDFNKRAYIMQGNFAVRVNVYGQHALQHAHILHQRLNSTVFDDAARDAGFAITRTNGAQSTTYKFDDRWEEACELLIYASYAQPAVETVPHFDKANINFFTDEESL